jgi:hypothetical protein
MTVGRYNPPLLARTASDGEVGMHTVEMLERMMHAAQQAGYTVRLEWLGGVGGGGCEFAGHKWIFIDLALSVAEQLEQLSSALGADPALRLEALPAPLRQHVRRSGIQRRAA